MLEKRYSKGVALCLVVLLASCSHLQFWKKRSPGPEPLKVESAEAVRETTEDREAELRRVVRKQIEAAERDAGQQSRVIRRKPYFYKEYAEYPEGADSAEVVVQETESITTPYVADVTVSKLRFATRLHRRRKEAAADANFLRDTGTERITFEMRNGKWVRVGGIFLADKTEEKIDGEWAPPREAVERTVAAEEEKAGSWLKRAWRSITGG